MADILAGKPVAQKLNEETKQRVHRLLDEGFSPCLATLRAGDSADDVYYESSVSRACGRLGMVHLPVVCPGDVSQEDLEARIFVLCGSYNVHGLLMFSPLPAHLDEAWARACIHPDKDVDCLTLANAAKVFMGDRSGFAPCTAQAVIEILRHYGVPLRGATVCVVGAGAVVGKPLAMLLLAEGATVSICNSKTRDLPAMTRAADIVVAAAGRPRLLGEAHLRPGHIVVDVGINPDPQDPTRICGDVDEKAAAAIAAAYTPVPGGVGSVTTALILQHTVRAAEEERAAEKRDRQSRSAAGIAGA